MLCSLKRLGHIKTLVDDEVVLLACVLICVLILYGFYPPGFDDPALVWGNLFLPLVGRDRKKTVGAEVPTEGK